ncbi:acetoacetate--CoA ligase [Gordonia sp. NB41Y]|uniref:acetoacetate--CoA ligase n=1 Tax=Gordonia sp. NB41Y TaxID=875808 RepID=UPI0002BD6252|nr:acetoacetate--CoA ligase [Gordonia sp. NB41Y]EMP12870.1 acetoacetyl-CoA synthetase [Gordonia sp. NB41Y]WLP88884.1 acetoacetate--CoA ligase [Gordonia sp. NB41Y]
MSSSPHPIWQPDPDALPATRLHAFTERVETSTGQRFPSYPDLWRWSVDHPKDFWSAVVDHFDILVDGIPADVLPDPVMPGARWFPGARVNYAENMLRHRGEGTAVVAVDEGGTTTAVSWEQLRGMVGAVQRWLREQGVGPGDRVVGYLPNSPAALVGMLATTGLGAIWSACGQDYGSDGATARLGQLDPVVLIAADGYRWNGRTHDRRDQTTALAASMPRLRAVLHVPRVHSGGLPDQPVPVGLWDEVISTPAEPVFERVEFNEPLWVLFSSGTTGVPKGIMHSHGGVTLDHARLLGLHNDLGPGDRFFWFTTTNWMMWNLVASGLLTGATVVLYDGAPGHPTPSRLWEIAAEHRVTVLGVSPGYLAASETAGVRPDVDVDLSALRSIGSTGAPLPAHAYRWVHDNVGPHIQLTSTTGGTDVVSGFAGSAPTTPVWPGEISAPLLGVDLQAWNRLGENVVDEVGELVIASPMPSMPVAFWNDPDGRRYRNAYFDTYPGVWRHGDWITITGRGSVVVSGRSDATLNRQGVRLGSADIYAVVDPFPEIGESLVIGAELDDGRYWMPLFVVVAEGYVLDDALRGRIVEALRTNASPRHVPDAIIAVPAIPHTRTGKKLEIPVKRIIQGAAMSEVVGADTVDDPAALQHFERFAPSPKPGEGCSSPGFATLP